MNLEQVKRVLAEHKSPSFDAATVQGLVSQIEYHQRFSVLALMSVEAFRQELGKLLPPKMMVDSIISIVTKTIRERGAEISKGITAKMSPTVRRHREVEIGLCENLARAFETIDTSTMPAVVVQHQSDAINSIMELLDALSYAAKKTEREKDEVREADRPKAEEISIPIPVPTDIVHVSSPHEGGWGSGTWGGDSGGSSSYDSGSSSSDGGGKQRRWRE